MLFTQTNQQQQSHNNSSLHDYLNIYALKPLDQLLTMLLQIHDRRDEKKKKNFQN